MRWCRDSVRSLPQKRKSTKIHHKQRIVNSEHQFAKQSIIIRKHMSAKRIEVYEYTVH
jgi:hypothetical protein